MSSVSAEALSADTVVAVEAPASRTPLCYIIDGEASIRHFLSLILHGAGFDTEEFPDGRRLAEALQRRHPDLVFLDVPLQSTEAIGCVVALGGCAYRGQIQLMSSRGSAVLQHVQNIGGQQHLTMLPPLRKPYETNVIVKLLDHLNLGHPPTVAGRLDIDKALDNDWIEFWYQPKIDLRRKQLVGAEAYARARHPTDGILLPAAFMPGASDSSLIALSERALSHSLKAAVNFAKLGVTLRMAINVPVNALMKMNVADIVQSYRPQFEKWPGLVIDVPEEQIVRDLELATDLS
jgi:CheY-like chemotaxis protein